MGLLLAEGEGAKSSGVKRMRRQVTGWEKIFVKHIENWFQNIQKIQQNKTKSNLLKFNHKKTNNKKWTKDLIRHLTPQKQIPMANKHMKRSSTSYHCRIAK